jgi:hypothetical protein
VPSATSGSSKTSLAAAPGAAGDVDLVVIRDSLKCQDLSSHRELRDPMPEIMKRAFKKSGQGTPDKEKN